MYCNKCGKVIDEQIGYCSCCESASSNKKPRKSAIVWAVRIIAILCLVGSLFCGISYYREPITIETIDTLGIVSNNLQNGGYVSGDSQYHYYFDETGLVRAEADNNLQSETIYQTNNIFGLNRNWVYVYSNNVFFADTDRVYYKAQDDSFSGITGNGMFECFFAETPTAHYVGTYGSQTGKYPLMYCGVQIADIPAERLCQYGLKLYVFSGEVTNGLDNDRIGLWQVDLDGGNPTQLLDFCPEYFVVWGEQAFFTNGEKLYISNVDGSNAQHLPDISVSGGLNVDSNYIYYVEAETGAIVRINKNGKNRKQLTQDNCSSIIILDNWMYYLRRIDGNTHLCRMDLQDLDEQIVVENWN